MVNSDFNSSQIPLHSTSIETKAIIQTDKSIIEDLRRDLSDATPKEQLGQLTRGLAAIQDRIAMLPLARNRVQIAIEMEDICKELERIGPNAINTCLKELNEIKTRYTPLLLHGGQNSDEKDLLAGEQKVLLSSLTTAYNLFSDVRQNIASIVDNKANLPFIQNDLEAIHSRLSSAMVQSSSSPTASVEFPTLKPSMLTTARLIITDSYARGKIGEAVGSFVKGIAASVKNAFRRHILRDETAEKPSLTMSKAKAVMMNSFVALSTFIGGLVFGKDLLAGSRNVVRTIDTKKDTDLEMTKTLKGKIANTKAFASVATMPISLERDRHISDGVCAGLSLELSLRVLRDENKGYRHFATQMARGAPPEAHANQSCYEALGSLDLTTESLEALLTKHQVNALSKDQGEGIFKADYGNVMNCYKAIINPRNSAFNTSPLAEAIQKADPNHFKQPVRGERYIADTQKFKEDVLRHLPTDDPEARTRAENELNWLVGNLEMRFVYNYLTNQMPGDFTTGTGGDLEALKEQPSFEGVLSFVSHPEVRKSLGRMFGDESDFNNYQTVARARGVSLERVPGMGFSYGAKNNSEILDRMNSLEDGCYVLSIDLKSGAHAMQFYKKGDEQYLFDPNFGVIDCSHGRHKEQITKLLASMESMYPPTKDQGPNSEGGSHNISLVKVVSDRRFTDTLANPDQGKLIFRG